MSLIANVWQLWWQFHGKANKSLMKHCGKFGFWIGFFPSSPNHPNPFCLSNKTQFFLRFDVFHMQMYWTLHVFCIGQSNSCPKFFLWIQLERFHQFSGSWTSNELFFTLEKAKSFRNAWWFRNIIYLLLKKLLFIYFSFSIMCGVWIPRIITNIHQFWPL